MLYITNCIPNEGQKSIVGRNFTFDEKNNSPSPSLFFCEDSIEIGHKSFFARCKELEGHILFFIHGFNTQPYDSLDMSSELQSIYTELNKKISVIPMVWPCGDKFGLLRDYWDDTNSAHLSAHSFSRLFDFFIGWRKLIGKDCSKTINILAHSKGNLLFREMINIEYNKRRKGYLLIKNAFLVAPDIADDSLEKGKSGYHISKFCDKVTVIHNRNDKALLASKALYKGARLGRNGPHNSGNLPDNVSVFDFTLNIRGDGHTYFLKDDKGDPEEASKLISCHINQ